MNTVGYALLGDAQAVPLITQDKSYQFAGSVTKTTGAHNIKLGGGAILREFSVNQSISPVGVYTFDTLATNNGAGARRQHDCLLPTRLSLAGRAGAQPVRSEVPHERAVALRPGRLARHLVADGESWVRYDVFTPFTEEDNHLSNFDPAATRQMLVAGASGVSKTAGVKTDFTDIAPRFGLAWTLPGADGRYVEGGGFRISPATWRHPRISRTRPSPRTTDRS